MCSEASHLVQVFLISLGLLNRHDGYRLYHTEYAVLCPVLSYLLQLLWPDRSQKETFPGHSWVNRITINYSLRVWSPDGMLTLATRAVFFMTPFHICFLCVHLCFDIYMSIAKRPIDEFVDIKSHLYLQSNFQTLKLKMGSQIIYLFLNINNVI